MRRTLSNILHFSLLTAIITAVIWAMVGPDNAGIYHNPLAVVGLGLIGLGLCKSQRDAINAAQTPATVPVEDRA